VPISRILLIVQYSRWQTNKRKSPDCELTMQICRLMRVHDKPGVIGDFFC
jgi:hypothetical protein